MEASEAIGKTYTTVAFDYGSLQLDDQTLNLYSTPSQDCFEFMWEVLCEGALGLIMLVSGKKPQDFAAARHILEFITARVSVPFILGISHSDYSESWLPKDVANYFGLPLWQVMALNATDPDDAREVLIRLLEQLTFRAASS